MRVCQSDIRLSPIPSKTLEEEIPPQELPTENEIKEQRNYEYYDWYKHYIKFRKKKYPLRRIV